MSYACRSETLYWLLRTYVRSRTLNISLSTYIASRQKLIPYIKNRPRLMPSARWYIMASTTPFTKPSSLMTTRSSILTRVTFSYKHSTFLMYSRKSLKKNLGFLVLSIEIKNTSFNFLSFSLSNSIFCCTRSGRVRGRYNRLKCYLSCLLVYSLTGRHVV